MKYYPRHDQIEAELVTLGGQELAACVDPAGGRFLLSKTELDGLFSCIPAKEEVSSQPPQPAARPINPTRRKVATEPSGPRQGLQDGSWPQRLHAAMKAAGKPVPVSWMVSRFGGDDKQRVYTAKDALNRAGLLVKTEAEDGTALWAVKE